MMHVQCTCVYSCVCCVWLCDESVHLGISVFLVPFLNFDSKFIVKSLAKEWPRIFIHRSTTAFSNSTLYCSYLAGMLWQMVSQWWRIESHPRTVSIILAFTLVSGVFSLTAVVLRDWRTITSIDSINWNTCERKNQYVVVESVSKSYMYEQTLSFMWYNPARSIKLDHTWVYSSMLLTDDGCCSALMDLNTGTKRSRLSWTCLFFDFLKRFSRLTAT